MTATIAPPVAAPRYATQRTPGLRSDGAQIAVTAKALGKPLMPWQHLVADVATQHHPTLRNRWRYQTVVVTVPRQAGKTVLVRALAVQRAITHAGSGIFTTAQMGKDARERWNDMVKDLDNSPLKSHTKIKYAQGSEVVKFPNQSTISPFAPGPKAVHGESPDLVIIDEAWAFDAAEGEDLMAAIRPAMITRQARQLWIISTAGTTESAFLRDFVDAGRLATQDPGSNIAYFEWSAPDAADTYDRDAWQFHPALGHLITVEDLAAEAEEMSRGNFERAYLNRWTISAETIIDLDAWDARAIEPNADDLADATPTIGFEVARDRSAAAIYAAWKTADGITQLRVVETGQGTHWLTPRLTHLHSTFGYATIGADDYGPNRPTIKQLKTLGIPVTVLKARDWADGCAELIAHVEDRTIEHDGSPALRTAIAAAAKRTLGADGGEAWSRRNSTAAIDPLGAATVAVKLAQTADVGIQIF